MHKKRGGSDAKIKRPPGHPYGHLDATSRRMGPLSVYYTPLGRRIRNAEIWAHFGELSRCGRRESEDAPQTRHPLLFLVAASVANLFSRPVHCRTPRHHLSGEKNLIRRLGGFGSRTPCYLGHVDAQGSPLLLDACVVSYLFHH